MKKKYLEIIKLEDQYRLERLVLTKKGHPPRRILYSDTESEVKEFLDVCTKYMKNPNTNLDSIFFDVEVQEVTFRVCIRNRHDFFEEPCLQPLLAKASRLEEREEIRSVQSLNGKIPVPKIALAFTMAAALLAAVRIKSRASYEGTIPETTTTMTSSLESPLPELTVAAEAPYIVEEQLTVVQEPSDFELIKLGLPTFGEMRDSKEKELVQVYEDSARKWGTVMGIDPELIECIMAQEKVIHSETKDANGAIGIMQIQYSQWIHQEIPYLDVQTGEWQKLKVDDALLKSVDGNIKVGTAILQGAHFHNENNFALMIQEYNYGMGKTNELLRLYEEKTGKTPEEVRENPYDLGWLAYCSEIKNKNGKIYGDPNYVEHILRRYEKDTLCLVTEDLVERVYTNVPKERTETALAVSPNPNYVPQTESQAESTVRKR